jgi:hypothetical protein
VATKVPKVPTPKIDLDAVGVKQEKHFYDSRKSGGNKDEWIAPSLKHGRQDIEDAYQATAAQNSPVRDAPAEVGLGEVDFYPVEFDGGDGRGLVSASVGKITPLQFMQNLYGDDRAKQNAKNLFLRNKPRTNAEGLFPIMGPSIQEHFGRPMYVVRTDTPARSNGSFSPGASVGHWSKADDLRRGMVEHELAGHGVADYGPFIDNSVLFGNRPRSPKSWGHGGLRVSQEEMSLLAGLIEEATQQATRKGGQLTRFGNFSNKALPPDSADELYNNMLNGYHFRDSEAVANGLTWKNQALQVSGEELASGGKQAEIDQLKAFLETKTPADPTFQAGPRKDLKADGFGFLDIQQKSIYRFLQATNPAKAEQYLNMLYRLGAVAAPAALPLLDENSDTGRD